MFREVSSSKIIPYNKSRDLVYPRITSFDALKQSTDICAHRFTFLVKNKSY